MPSLIIQAALRKPSIQVNSKGKLFFADLRFSDDAQLH